MANVVYNEYKKNLINGTAVFPPSGNVDTTYAVILTSGSYTPSELDTATQVAAAEIPAVAGNYDRKYLTSITVTSADGGATVTDDYYKVDAADCSFGSNVTITAAGAAIVKLAVAGTLGTAGQGGAIGSVVTFVDFGGSKSSDNGEFTIVWNANGVLNYKQGV